MAKLPQKMPLDQMQTTWATLLNPLLNNATTDTVFLKNVKLTTGDNIVNHTLGRKLQGWYPVRYHGGWAQIYDKQDTNQMANLTLLLNASANVLIDLVVF